MRYLEVHPISRKAAEEALASDDVETVCNGLLSTVFYDDDWQWAQDQCLILLDHESPDVKLLAATCLGHVARIHKTLDKEKVVRALQHRMDDPELRGTIQDALDDIKMFVHD
jgi:hypothetical protein